jgi:aarF domain-containing kinase
VHERVANRILQLSKDNRGIYLKLGQYLGNLERVVPWEFTTILKVLQDSAPPLPYEQMKVIFETDLKKPSEEIFSFIDETPIASASLAQVHRGRLASNGKEVAIKMQYPFLGLQSKWDLLMLKQITQICNFLVKCTKNAEFDFIKLFNEWTATLVEELDFSIEVRHALKAKELFKGQEGIYIPEYYTELCSDRLIVMEFVEGIKVSQKEEMLRQGIDPKLVGKNLVTIFTTMIFKHGFVHCDAHPGNFLIRPKANSQGHEIVLLDHGLYRSLRPQTIRNFSGLFLSLLLQEQQKVNEYA